MLLNEGHAKNINHLRPFFIVLGEHLVDQDLQVLRVHIRDRSLFVLDNLEYESEQILS